MNISEQDNNKRIFKRFYYQTEKENQNIIMTHPHWQPKPDTIGEYGCLLIAKLNAYNHKFNQDKQVKELNDEVIANKGYEYLNWLNFYNGDIAKTKVACFGKESFLVREVINRLLNIKGEERNYTGVIDIQSPTDYYIIRTKHKNTGHYSLVIDKDMKYFDSYDGKTITPQKRDILEVIRIRF